MLPLEQIIRILIGAAVSGGLRARNTLERGKKMRPLQNMGVSDPGI